MTPLTYDQIAATVLAEIRAIYPTGRKQDPDITEAWARVLARSHMNLPATVWREAVTTWSVSHPEPPTPHDLIATAKQVAAQWEGDPGHRDKLAEFRVERLRHREAAGELPAGTAPETTADAALAIEAPDRPSRATAGRQWRNLRAELRSQALALPAGEADGGE